jgi:hypothetical protein
MRTNTHMTTLEEFRITFIVFKFLVIIICLYRDYCASFPGSGRFFDEITSGAVELFPQTEPWKTFANVFEKHDLSAMIRRFFLNGRRGRRIGVSSCGISRAE